MAQSRTLLILRYHDLRSEVSSFFAALNEERALRSLFFTNPSIVLRSKLPSLSGAVLDDQQDDLANKVLFSVLSNEKFITFLKDYQEKKNKALARFLKTPEDKQAARDLDSGTIRMEFAEALLKFGDKELLFNMIGKSSTIPGDGSPHVLISHLILVLSIAVIVGIHVLVHTVVKLGISGPAAPPAFDKLPISASDLRQIADQLVAAAKQARETGNLVQ